jgi:propanol-preferring alcohol dehydrogenase
MAGFVSAVDKKANVQTETVPYHLERANEALNDLRMGRLQGAAVLIA